MLKSKICYLPKERYCNTFGNDLTMQCFQPYLDQLVWQDVYARKVKTYKTCWMVRSGCQCVYKYGNQTIKPVTFDDIMSALTLKIEHLMGYEPEHFNSCNLNAYMESNEYVEWHCDNEELFINTHFDRNVDIVSLSMGGTRNMLFRKKQGEEKAEIQLHDGDLCFMGGRLQDHFLHHIPKWTEAACGPFAPRVNFTWRSIKKHTKGCALRSTN
jgi:alkylated DNA repair dioxygenase AlkB